MSLKERFTSRKFLLTLAASIFSVVAQQTGIPDAVINGVLNLAMLYVGVEGGADFISAYARHKAAEKIAP